MIRGDQYDKVPVSANESPSTLLFYYTTKDAKSLVSVTSFEPSA